ncbi:MAG: cellobiose phosphorylase, partial [Candidatus Margulisiibacteriota bacterium]
SLSETLELKRLCLYLKDQLVEKAEIGLPVELKALIDALTGLLLDEAIEPFAFWEAACDLKENFRKTIKFGVSGEEAAITAAAAAKFLKLVAAKCDRGTKKCLEKYGNYFTYFINEVADFEHVDGNKIKVKRFVQIPLPLFLEGFVHALKTEKDKNIYQLVKNSPLYDKELKMYKVNAPLVNTPVEIGRAKVFAPGWLENESVWLHMEYKYMLELLKAGLYHEFFDDFKKVLVPYMDPKVYKRSTLENSSFIVSSANPSKQNHGRGFVARLSGGAAEFIDIWITMMTGKNIFNLDEKGALYFKLAPIIPAWLFKNGKLSFKLLGSIDVTYINKKEKDTFGKGVAPVEYKLIFDDAEEVTVRDSVVKEPYAKAIRERKVKKLVVTLT